ncbi:MAG: hypothetical protein ACNA78_05800 [Balneolaceae bacterium]
MDNSILSVKEWFITVLVTAIPVVGIIMLFVWGFGSGTHPSKANWAKATLLLYAVAVALSFLVMMIFGAAFIGMMGDM